MRILSFLILLVTSITLFAKEIRFDHYHNQSEIQKYMTTVALKNHQFVYFQTLGRSLQGRNISLLAISHRPLGEVPAIYFNGTHHGDEWSSTEAVLALADYLITNHNRPEVAAILNRYTIYIQPLVNPDGHAMATRADSLGRDPNRDYSSPSKPEANSFALPETVIVKKVVDAIRPVAAGAFHSGLEEVLWPWCQSGDATAHNGLMAQLAQSAASAMRFDRYMQSYYDYPTDGEFIDYAYMKYRTIALTFEVSNVKVPPVNQLEQVVQRAVAGSMAFLSSVEAIGSGKMIKAGYSSFRGQPGRVGKRPKGYRKLE